MTQPYRAPITEVIARMKERLGTACFGSADAGDAEQLIAEYERLDWRPITETDLPKIGDEVLEFNARGRPLIAVVYTDWPCFYVSYKGAPCYKRPIATPTIINEQAAD